MASFQKIRKSLGMSQAQFARLLKVSESMVSLQELNQRKFPSAALDKASALETAFQAAEGDISIPDPGNYFSLLKAKMGQDASFKDEINKQKKKLTDKIRKAGLDKDQRLLDRSNLFEKFHDLWKTQSFLKKHILTVTDPHDLRFLGDALFFAGYNLEKAGYQLMKLDSEIAELDALEKAIILRLKELEEGD